MRKKTPFRNEDDEPIVDISSLIDVCFLLLIYFIVTSTIAEPESDLVLRLPDRQGSAAPSIIEPATFSVDQDGTISEGFLNHDKTAISSAGIPNEGHRLPSQMPELMDSLQLYSSVAQENAMVIVDVHDEAPTQYVVDLVNALQAKNIRNVTFVQ